MYVCAQGNLILVALGWFMLAIFSKESPEILKLSGRHQLGGVTRCQGALRFDEADHSTVKVQVETEGDQKRTDGSK